MYFHISPSKGLAQSTVMYVIPTVFHSPGREYNTCVFIKACGGGGVPMVFKKMCILLSTQIMSQLSTQFLGVQNLCRRNVSVSTPA
jgi:hypothetical protein